jgi:hypothetical protein
MARHLFVRCEKTAIKKQEMKNHFISIISCESIIPIGHVISQKMAIEITRQVQKVLTCCLHFDDFLWCGLK